LLLQYKNEISVIVSDDKVINIYRNNQSVSISMDYIQVVIRFTMFETKSKKENVNLSIPSSRRLLQTIKRLIDLTNRVRICHKTRRLLHENLFRQVSVKKSIIHIHLMDLPSKSSSKRKNHLNKVHLRNRGKGISVFDAFLLRKSIHNQARFMTLNNTFKGKFGPVDPSTLHNILFLRSGNKFPSVIL
jgi:hypothetical protein